MELIVWAGCKAMSYLAIPVCIWSANKILNNSRGAQIVAAVTARVTGTVTLSLKKNKNYAFVNGALIELDKRCYYTICGNIVVNVTKDEEQWVIL